MMTIGLVSAGIEIINHGGASLPRESENDLPHRGVSWNSAASNWMEVLRSGVNSIGSGREIALREHDLGDYYKMLTSTSIRTWKGMDDTSGPNVEWGNFWHQGVQIKATEGSTFVPSVVSVRVQSFSLDSGGNYVAGSLDRTVTFTELNFFRQVLNLDGSVSASQNPNAAVSNFLYGGVGVALTMGGSGTTQEKLDATANNWWNKQYKLRYTVTVPYSEGTESLSWEVERQKPETVVMENQISLTNTVVGKSYEIQFSPTLNNDWQVLSTQIGTGNPIMITMIHMSDLTTNPKMFYRVKY